MRPYRFFLIFYSGAFSLSCALFFRAEIHTPYKYVLPIIDGRNYYPPVLSSVVFFVALSVPARLVGRRQPDIGEHRPRDLRIQSQNAARKLMDGNDFGFLRSDPQSELRAVVGEGVMHGQALCHGFSVLDLLSVFPIEAHASVAVQEFGERDEDAARVSSRYIV